MPDILHRGAIESSAVKVFHVLSEERGLAGWWTGDVDASPTVGAIDQFRFGDHGFNEMKVVEFVPAGASNGSVWMGPRNGSAPS
jgi:uncharacterized protein YndB with AHSA1/START domain